MTVRIYWMGSEREPPVFASVRRNSGPTYTGLARSWLIVGSLTLVFLLWLAYRWVIWSGWPASIPGLVREAISLGEAGMAFALALTWFALLLRKRNSLGVSITSLGVAELYSLTPKEFEAYVAGLFRRKGYAVTLRGGSGDHGVDLELETPTGRRGIVQCKRYQSTVGEKVVRELFGTMIHERAAHAFLVTTAEVSEAAHDWSAGKPMTLIDGEVLVKIAKALNA